MSAQIADVLPEVVGNVIATQAFAFVDPCDGEDLAANDDPCICTQIAFQGPVSGIVKWAVPKPLCINLAANILGLDDDDPIADGDAFDAVQELLNVICGQMLTRLFGSEPIFRLSIPHVEERDAAIWQDLADCSQTVGVCIDDVPTAICIKMAEEIS